MVNTDFFIFFFGMFGLVYFAIGAPVLLDYFYQKARYYSHLSGKVKE